MKEQRAAIFWNMLGLACCLFLTGAVHLNVASTIGPWPQGALFLGESLGCVVCILVGRSPTLRTPLPSVGALVAAGLFAIYGMLFVVANGSKFGLPTEGFVLAYGAFLGIAYCMQGKLISTLGMRQAVFAVIGAMICSGILSLVGLVGAPKVLSTAVCALCAVGIPVSWSRLVVKNALDPNVRQPAPNESIDVGSLRPLAVGVSMFSFIIAFSANATAPAEAVAQLVMYGLSAVLSLYFLLVLCYNRHGFAFGGFWLLLLVLVSTGHALPALGVATSTALAIIQVAQGVVIIVVYLSLADIGRRSEHEPLSVYGFGWGIYSCSTMLGYLAAGLSGYNLSAPTGPLILDAILALVAFVLVGHFGDRDIQLFHDLRPCPPVVDAFEISLKETSRRIGLTPREEEVALLYGQGRSRAYIAQKLVLSENTVREHIRNVYRKAGVANKQELIDVIEANAEQRTGE